MNIFIIFFNQENFYGRAIISIIIFYVYNVYKQNGFFGTARWVLMYF